MDMKADRYGYLRKTGAIGVCAKAIPVTGSTHGEGSLGAKSEAKTGLAKRANLEGNESARYEKLEKRSLRALKEGGSEKELRQGHNDLIVGKNKRGVSTAKTIDTLGVKRANKLIRGGGDTATAVRAERPVLAARHDTRAAVKQAKASGVPGAVKGVRAAGREAVKMAKTDPNSRKMERKARRAAR